MARIIGISTFTLIWACTVVLAQSDAQEGRALLREIRASPSIAQQSREADAPKTHCQTF